MGIKVLDFKGSPVAEEAVPEIFSGKVNNHVIWEIVVAEQSNARQGTHKTKEKGEVSGGGKKPFKQKGTGRARAGSIRAPNWKGGGTVFGPRPRDYIKAIPRKKKLAGIRNIFTSKIGDQKLVLLNELSMEKPSTSQAFSGFASIIAASPFAAAYGEKRKLRAKTNDQRRKIALIYSEDNQIVKKSLRNIPWIMPMHVDRVAAESLWYNHGIICTKEAFKKIVEKAKG